MAVRQEYWLPSTYGLACPAETQRRMARRRDEDNADTLNASYDGMPSSLQMVASQLSAKPPSFPKSG